MLLFGPVEYGLVSIPCIWVAARAYYSLRDTTLLAPALWCGLAVAAALPAYFHNYNNDLFDGTYYRYTAAVLLIAPTLALLGAKRPQNGAWQFIVFTLVTVLLLPVMQGWAFGDRSPSIHPLFLWVIATHILIGFFNYLPTRYVGPVFFLASGQTFMAAEHFPAPLTQLTSFWRLTIPCLFIALFWANYLARNTPSIAPCVSLLWRDFRDAYGLVWGLRIAERLNASAQKHGWPVEFTWGGMIVRDGAELDAETRHRVEREMRSHLRRFVSHDWIAARLPDAQRPDATSPGPLTGTRGSE
jgi:hypothetical protein